MATACTRSGFTTDGACYTQPQFTTHEQLAILVLRLALWSDAAADSEYINQSSGSYGTLLTESNNATCGLTQDQMVAGLIGVLSRAIGNGDALVFGSGNGVPEMGSVTATATAIQCLKNLTDDQLNKMVLFLSCKLVAVIAELP